MTDEVDKLRVENARLRRERDYWRDAMNAPAHDVAKDLMDYYKEDQWNRERAARAAADKNSYAAILIDLLPYYWDQYDDYSAQGYGDKKAHRHARFDVIREIGLVQDNTPSHVTIKRFIKKMGRPHQD
jgi:hypothetical protein